MTCRAAIVAAPGRCGRPARGWVTSSSTRRADRLLWVPLCSSHLRSWQARGWQLVETAYNAPGAAQVDELDTVTPGQLREPTGRRVTG